MSEKRQTSKLALRRGFQLRDTTGFWVSADERFGICHSWEGWEIYPERLGWLARQADQQMLSRHGLLGVFFSTRREATRRLQDALQLEEGGGEKASVRESG